MRRGSAWEALERLHEAAGLRVAELPGEVGGELGEKQRGALPSAMGRFVISDLRAAVTG